MHRLCRRECAHRGRARRAGQAAARTNGCAALAASGRRSCLAAATGHARVRPDTAREPGQEAGERLHGRIGKAVVQAEADAAALRMAAQVAQSGGVRSGSPGAASS